jgi:DNA polymerase IV
LKGVFSVLVCSPKNSGVFLHCDINNFFAAVECLYHPEHHEDPVVVCGSCDFNRGIVLAGNYPAKAQGIQTGEAIMSARRKCPDLIIFKASYPRYLKYARLIREIYADYTDKITIYGLDEAWLDVSESTSLFGEGVQIADRIRSRVKSELGLTVSVGVSFNRIFSKLGSDMKKPDATTLISPEDFERIVWKLPVKDLLFVGKSVRHKLFLQRIITIGDLANASPILLKRILGKNGLMLWQFANGDDSSFFPNTEDETRLQSIGNHITPPARIVSPDDVRLLLYMLSDAVSSRLRSNHLKARAVRISLKDTRFNSCEFQMTLRSETHSGNALFAVAWTLFEKNYRWERSLRSIGIRVSRLSPSEASQRSLFDEEESVHSCRMEDTIDEIRRRFGYFSVERALLLKNHSLTKLPLCSEYTTGLKLKRWEV